MALVRHRRQPNLRLPLPEPSDRCHRFPLPLPPTTTTNNSNNNNKSSVIAGAGAAFTTTTNGEAINSGDIEKLEVLGHGNGGTVYKVRHKRTSAIYALKVVHSSSDATTRRRIRTETEILRRAADSPYVVRYHGSSENPFSGEVAILMEYMDSGTLETLLKTNGTFNEASLAKVARDVLNGLNYLHARKIVHRDIKPANLLVNKNNEVKIGDFGVSKLMSRTLDACNSYVGTCAYMSPERFDPNAYGGNYNGYAADIWSLGLTLLELYMGYFPLLQEGERPDWATLMWAICFGEPPCLPENASPEFRSFMECCLKKDSSERWTAPQLLTHPFVCRNNDPEGC